MSWDPTPWFVGGGALHSPEVARTNTYASTSGAEGIVGGADLKVTAQTVPGSTVRVAPGAALILNRASGGSSQTYTARLATEDTVAIASTGGTARNDLIIARIEDPFVAGEPWQTPADPTTGQYVFTRVLSNVPALAISSNLEASKYLRAQGFTAIPLAGVAMTPNTATVTGGLLKELRKVAIRRSEKVTGSIHPTTETRIDTTSFKTLATVGGIEVPEWATHVNVDAILSGLDLNDGNASGTLRVGFTGWFNTEGTLYDENQTVATGTGRYGRSTYAISRSADVPLAQRGTLQEFNYSAMRDSGGGTGHLQVDSGSTLTYSIEFIEKAA